MAYRDPYQGEERYYNPYENTQQPESNALGTAVGIAKNLAVFGLLNIAGVAITHQASGAAGRWLAKRGTGRLKQFGDIAKQLDAPTIGGILKETTAGKTVRAFADPLTRPFKQALLQRQQTIALAKAQGVDEGNIARITSTFKSFKTFAGTMGSLWKKNVWSGAGVAYGLDTMLGASRDLGIENKPLYDIPGQIGNFGKWLGFNTVYGMGFGAFVPALKAATGSSILGLRKAFSGQLGDAAVKFMSKVAPAGIIPGKATEDFFDKSVLESARNNYQQHFVVKAVQRSINLGSAVSENWRYINTSFKEGLSAAFEKTRPGMAKPSLSQRAKSAWSPVAAAIKTTKEFWVNREAKRSVVLDTPGQEAMIGAYQIANEAAKDLSPTKDFGAVSALLKSHVNALDNRKNVIQRIFPQLAPLRVGDVASQKFMDQVYGNLSKRYTKDSAKEFVSNLSRMHVGPRSYKLPGSYAKGAGVDLTMFNPLNIVRRAVVGLIDKPFHIPFSQVPISIGEITRATQILSESPSIGFFDYPLSLRADTNHIGKPKTLAEMGEFGDPKHLMYVNGKWALIGESGDVQVVDTGRKLQYSSRGGAEKQNELLSIQLRNVTNKAWAANITEDKTKASHWATKLYNRFTNFLGKHEISLPGIINNKLMYLTERLEGRNHAYIDGANDFFTTLKDDKLDRAVPLMSKTVTHTRQDLATLLQKKEGLQILARYTDAKYRGDFLGMNLNDSEMIDKLDYLKIHANDEYKNLIYGDGIREAHELARAYPKVASKHLVVKPLGKLSAMSSNDILRSGISTNIFNKSFAESGYKDHPLLQAIPELLQKGLINQRTAKSLSLHAKLSALIDEPLKYSTKPSRDSAFITAVESAQRMDKTLGWGTQRELIDFVSNQDMRSSYIRTKEEKILDANPGISNISPYVSVPKKFFPRAIDNINIALGSVSRLSEELYFFKRDPHTTATVPSKLAWLGKNVLKTAAGVLAWKVLDASIAANPLFDDTAFEAGLGGFLADNVAKARLGTSKVLDAVGVTGVARHLNGLMPGFTTSAPGAIVGAVVSRTLGGGPLEMLKGFAFGAIGNRMLAPYMPDITKTNDQLEAEYSGRTMVPFMKNPAWLLGGTPWQGTKVEGYQPNWYVRTKSRWKESDTLYGSALAKVMHEPIFPLGISIGDFVDPYYMERKHFFSRPYPETGGWGEEVPIIGPLISSTIGKIIKPKIKMHREFLNGPDRDKEYDESQFKNAPPGLFEHLSMMKGSIGLSSGGTARSVLYGSYAYQKGNMWAHGAGENFLKNFSNLVGLPGFIGRSVSERLVEQPIVMPTLETAGRIASQTRAYYDMNLGGMGIFTEGVRRLMVPKDMDRFGINPIPNMFPDWLPQEFLTADPYAKIIRGELRLPGDAYRQTHPGVRRNMPARASMFGAPLEHAIQYFTGLLPPVLKEEYDIMGEGTATHRIIQNSLAAENMLIKAEQLVYDAKNDISGHVDAIIRDGKGGKGRRALEIKTISDQGFDKLDAPKYQHMCLKDTNNVIMNDGSIKSIKDVESGQFIRNKFGEKEQVISTSKREINELIYKITMFGQSNNSIDCTHNHELFGIKTKRCSCSNIFSMSSPCFEGRGHCLKCKHQYYENYKPDWIEAKNLNEGDFLLRYKPKYGTFKYFSDQFDITNYTTNRSRKKPNFIAFDYDIGKLFGYYLAEGSITKRQTIWSFHIKEKEYTDDISTILKSIGLDSTIDEQYENNVRNIVCNSTVFSAIIRDLFSKTKTKKIDRRLFTYNIEFLRGIFDGYMRGDGHITKENKYILGTASYQLVIDLMDLCIILGYYPALTIKRQKKCSIKGIWVKTENLFYRLDFYKDRKSNRFIRDFGEYIGYRIRKIDKYIYNGYVYDIEVENSRSFSLTNVISSNSQLNFYLKQLKMRQGTLLYVNRDNPAQVKTFTVNYSQSRWEKDLNKLQQSRQMAADMMQQGIADSYGISYSWLDRLGILADVAPSSQEYKEAKYLVQVQIKNGLLTPDEISKYKSYLQHRQARIRKYELYPNRFKGKILSPDTEINIQNINEDIKAGAEYSLPERVVGAAWEYFTNTNSFLTNKFFAFKDPLAHYKMTRLYGMEYKPWDEPYRAWIEPYSRGLLSKTDPITGAIAGATAGTLLGGAIGGTIGGGLGSVYGTVHGLTRMFSNSAWVPSIVEEQRELDSYFDKAKYEKAGRLRDLTEGLARGEYQSIQNSTLTAYLSNKKGTIVDLFRATPVMEKPYIEAWLKVKDGGQRKDILKFLPVDLASSLEKAWAGEDQKDGTAEMNTNNSAELARGIPKYSFDRSILDPSVLLEDIKLKTINEEGLEAHDFGLGWSDQMYRLQSSYNDIQSANVQEEPVNMAPDVSSVQVRQMLIGFFKQMGYFANIMVYINNGSNDMNVVNITIKRDRANSIINAIRNTQRYNG